MPENRGQGMFVNYYSYKPGNPETGKLETQIPWNINLKQNIIKHGSNCVMIIFVAIKI